MERKEEFSSGCVEFDTTTGTWKEVGRLKKGRVASASADFQGRVTTCGGYDGEDPGLKTVEAYDGCDWSFMPSMNQGRYCHKAAAFKNKLFVFGGGTNEVFDSVCGKFAFLKPPPRRSKVDRELRDLSVVLMGSRVVIFLRDSALAVVYDVALDEWTEVTCEATAGAETMFACVKVPAVW